jgi:hypothetical protein
VRLGGSASFADAPDLRPDAARGATIRDKRPQRGRWPTVALPGQTGDMAERIMLAIVFIALTLFFFALLIVPHVPFLAGAD